MSEKNSNRTMSPGSDEEGFLSRWSRLKNAERSGVVIESEQDASPVPASAEEVITGAAEEPPLTDADMPPLDTLTGDSDISGFLSQGVSHGLRRAALRKLFHSPKFNVCDGLDDYCDDFRNFAPLGSTITADMRHHMERLLKERLAEAGEAEEPISAHEPAVDPELAAAGSTDDRDNQAVFDEDEAQAKVKDDGTDV